MFLSMIHCVPLDYPCILLRSLVLSRLKHCSAFLKANTRRRSMYSA